MTNRGAAPPDRVGAALAVLLALLLALSACSESDPAPPDWPAANPAIYEIASKDGSVEGWILGTIHALPDGVEWRTAAIAHAMDDADLLVLEVDNFTEAAPVFARLSSTAGLGEIEPRVAAEIRPELEAMIRRSDYNSGDFRDMEDWAAAIVLSQVDAPGRASNGVDRALLAAFAGREVRGLETAAEQLGAFDTLAAADQRVLLEKTVRDWAEGPGEREELLRAWIAGDVARLEQAARTGIMADPELREALLTGRNADWMEQLIPLLRGGDRPLVAVGAAHVVGSDGLPALLEARGYTVTRLP